MTTCFKCQKKFPFFTIREAKRPNPLGDGYLCETCYRPYHLVLEKYSANIKKIDTDPTAAAWVALCCHLAAKQINLERTITAVLCGVFEAESSWKVCRKKAMELAAKAMSMIPSDSNGQMFLTALFNLAEKMSTSPARELSIRLHASVMGDKVPDIEYQALLHSGVTIDELNALIQSLSGYQWLCAPGPRLLRMGKS
ncbi:hypothetical protein ACFL7E_05170 [Thermodesulfobacteriota bacterium]